MIVLKTPVLKATSRLDIHTVLHIEGIGFVARIPWMWDILFEIVCVYNKIERNACYYTNYINFTLNLDSVGGKAFAVLKEVAPEQVFPLLWWLEDRKVPCSY